MDRGSRQQEAPLNDSRENILRQAVDPSHGPKAVSARLYLLIIITIIIAYSLAPFDFSFSAMELRSRVNEAIGNSFDRGLLKVVGHFITFFILGGMIAVVKERSSKPYGFGRFVLVATIFCTCLEFSQLFLSGRHATFTDLFSNTAGVLLGAKSSIWWHRAKTIRPTLQEHTRQYRFHAQAGVFILASTIWLAVGFLPLWSGLRMGWNKDFHLLIGNELDRSRPWLGEIRYVRIYGRALTVEQVSRIHKTLETKNERQEHSKLELLVEYDFTQGNSNVVFPVGSLKSYDLSIQVPAGAGDISNGGGIFLKEPSVLETRGAAAELTEAITSSGAFSVEAWIRPIDDRQEGPARIVTLSESIWSSNFMLGQEATGLIFRVRNGINGGNGFRFALHGKNTVQDGLQHVVAVYDHGVSSIFLDGRLIQPVVDLREPAAYIHLGTNSVGRFFSMILLILTVALPCYSMFSFVGRDGVRHAAAIVSTFCIGTLPYVAINLFIGGSLRLGFFMWLVIVILIVYPICIFYVYPPLPGWNRLAKIVE